MGVVGSLAMNARNPERDAGVYHPYGPGELHPIRCFIEVGGDPNSFVPQLRSLASQVDPASMIQNPQPVTKLVADSNVESQWASTILILLSGVAVVLSVAGLYALMSFTVERRTREIGIRTALGANPSSVVTTIARRALFQLAVGVSLGVVLGTALLQNLADDSAIRSMSIPLVITAVSGAVVLVGMFACFSPTLRGLRVPPTDALREG